MMWQVGRIKFAVGVDTLVDKYKIDQPSIDETTTKSCHYTQTNNITANCCTTIDLNV